VALIGSSRRWRTLTGARVACAAVLALAGSAIVHPQSTSSQILPFPPVATFSILGFDPATGEVGGAVQSRVFSVGNGVLWAEADAGVAATQAIVDVSYGPKALALLRAGMTPSAIVKAILDSDPDPRPSDWTKEGRQFAVMDAKGDYRHIRDRKRRHGPETRVASTAPRRETFSRAKVSSPAWSRRLKRPKAACRCG